MILVGSFSVLTSLDLGIHSSDLCSLSKTSPLLDCESQAGTNVESIALSFQALSRVESEQERRQASLNKEQKIRAKKLPGIFMSAVHSVVSLR